MASSWCSSRHKAANRSRGGRAWDSVMESDRAVLSAACEPAPGRGRSTGSHRRRLASSDHDPGVETVRGVGIGVCRVHRRWVCLGPVLAEAIGCGPFATAQRTARSSHTRRGGRVAELGTTDPFCPRRRCRHPRPRPCEAGRSRIVNRDRLARRKWLRTTETRAAGWMVCGREPACWSAAMDGS